MKNFQNWKKKTNSKILKNRSHSQSQKFRIGTGIPMPTPGPDSLDKNTEVGKSLIPKIHIWRKKIQDLRVNPYVLKNRSRLRSPNLDLVNIFIFEDFFSESQKNQKKISGWRIISGTSTVQLDMVIFLSSFEKVCVL